MGLGNALGNFAMNLRAVGPQVSLRDLAMLQELKMKQDALAASQQEVTLPAITDSGPALRSDIVEPLIRERAGMGMPLDPQQQMMLGAGQQGGYGQVNREIMPSQTVPRALAPQTEITRRGLALEDARGRRAEAKEERDPTAILKRLQAQIALTGKFPDGKPVPEKDLLQMRTGVKPRTTSNISLPVRTELSSMGVDPEEAAPGDIEAAIQAIHGRSKAPTTKDPEAQYRGILKDAHSDAATQTRLRFPSATLTMDANGNIYPAGGASPEVQAYFMKLKDETVRKRLAIHPELAVMYGALHEVPKPGPSATTFDPAQGSAAWQARNNGGSLSAEAQDAIDRIQASSLPDAEKQRRIALVTERDAAGQ